MVAREMEGRIRTYKYVWRVEDSTCRKGDRHGNRPPVSRGDYQECKRGTSRVDGRRRIPRADVFEFLDPRRSDDQPLGEGQAQCVIDLPGVRPP
jgi:hypothetical protein